MIGWLKDPLLVTRRISIFSNAICSCLLSSYSLTLRRLSLTFILTNLNCFLVILIIMTSSVQPINIVFVRSSISKKFHRKVPILELCGVISSFTLQFLIYSQAKEKISRYRPRTYHRKTEKMKVTGTQIWILITRLRRKK